MARPTRPSDRVRDLVLLARTPTSPGQPDVGLPRRSSMPSRALCARRGLGGHAGRQTRRTPTRRRIVGGLRDDASVTSAPETERPESSEPSESPEAPAAEPASRPAAARAARRADGAPGGAVRAGAAVRAGVGERADGQLAEGPGPPGAHAAQPHRVPAAGARRHGHLRGRPAGAGGGPDRSGGGGRPGHRRADLAAGGGRGPGRHGSAATVCRCGRWAACSSTTRWPGRARTRSPAAARACRSTRAPPRTRWTRRCRTSRSWPVRTTPCSPCRATAPSWPAPPGRCCRASTCSPRPPPPSRRGRCG